MTHSNISSKRLKVTERDFERLISLIAGFRVLVRGHAAFVKDQELRDLVDDFEGQLRNIYKNFKFVSDEGEQVKKLSSDTPRRKFSFFQIFQKLKPQGDNP